MMYRSSMDGCGAKDEIVRRATYALVRSCQGTKHPRNAEGGKEKTRPAEYRRR
jgi:hypothetical protein